MRFAIFLCHEFPRAKVYETAEVSGFLESTSQFINATHESLSKLLFGESPSTRIGMQDQAAQELATLEAELKALEDGLRSGAVGYMQL